MSRQLTRALVLFVTVMVLTYINVPSAGAGYLYALRNVTGGMNQIYGFQVNELTGTLTPLPGFPINTVGDGSAFSSSEQLSYDPAKRQLYAINDGSSTISAYSVNPRTGALTALPFSPIPLGSGHGFFLAVHPSGSPLVAGNGSNDTLASFNITGTGATPASGSPFATSAGAPLLLCVFSRDGNYIYTGGFSSRMASFSVNTGTGVLTPLSGSPYNLIVASPMAYATDSNGRLFLANFSANGIRAFTTSNGIPSPVLGNPFTSGLSQAVHGLLHPAGYYLVADRAGRVGVYRINGSGSNTTLLAVAGSPFSSGGTFTNVLAFNQSGAFLFAANGNSRNITSYAFDPVSGALTVVGLQPANTMGIDGLITGMTYAGFRHLFLPLIHR
jgi:6-phosphogluconolactonase (cycloisomerase 2 family)